jgi:hypothetical protein
MRVSTPTYSSETPAPLRLELAQSLLRGGAERGLLPDARCDAQNGGSSAVSSTSGSA